jgi:hypothetical protein
MEVYVSQIKVQVPCREGEILLYCLNRHYCQSFASGPSAYSVTCEALND